MKIVIAPDSYKESLSALEVAQAVEAGFRQVFPDADYVLVPVADGGEGTVDAMVAATGGRKETVTAGAPPGHPGEAFSAPAGDGATAVTEMAAASGLALVPPDRRNPLLTNSRGTGELIRAALDAGARRFILGIGGSATTRGAWATSGGTDGGVITETAGAGVNVAVIGQALESAVSGDRVLCTINPFIKQGA